MKKGLKIFCRILFLLTILSVSSDTIPVYDSHSSYLGDYGTNEKEELIVSNHADLYHIDLTFNTSDTFKEEVNITKFLSNISRFSGQYISNSVWQPPKFF